MTKEEARRAIAILVWFQGNSSKTVLSISSSEGRVSIDSQAYRSGRLTFVDANSGETIKAESLSSSSFYADYGSSYQRKLYLQVSGSSFTADDLSNNISYRGTIGSSTVNLTGGGVSLEFTISYS